MFKESKTHIHPEIKTLTDNRNQAIAKIHGNSALPKKNGKKNKLTKEAKASNPKLSRDRALNDNLIGMVK